MASKESKMGKKKGTAGNMCATSIITQKHRPNSDKNQGEVMASYAELSTVYDTKKMHQSLLFMTLNQQKKELSKWNTI
jgi:hypothetical protein